jgi:hypothetical protein
MPLAPLSSSLISRVTLVAPGPQDVEDPIQHLAHIHRAFAPAMPRRRDHGLHNRPFAIGQIAWVTKATAVRSKTMFGLPHRALSKENQAPNKESHPIHQTQELPGSALRVLAGLDPKFALTTIWPQSSGCCRHRFEWLQAYKRQQEERVAFHARRRIVTEASVVDVNSWPVHYAVELIRLCPGDLRRTPCQIDRRLV